jgi:hypothetical protein
MTLPDPSGTHTYLPPAAWLSDPAAIGDLKTPDSASNHNRIEPEGSVIVTVALLLADTLPAASFAHA